MIALFVLAYYVLHFTRIGRYVYAVGGNESCARLSGINVKAIKLIVYTFSGFCCGIAALHCRRPVWTRQSRRTPRAMK